MRIYNTELPIVYEKDPSEYYVNKVTEYIKKHFSKDKVKRKIQQRHQNKSFKATERKKTWPCNKKRKNDMKLRYF